MAADSRREMRVEQTCSAAASRLRESMLFSCRRKSETYSPVRRMAAGVEVARRIVVRRRRRAWRRRAR